MATERPRSTKTMNGKLVKQCQCGCVFDFDAWRLLRLIGILSDDLAENEDLEMRNCSCGSTIAIYLDELQEMGATTSRATDRDSVDSG